MPEGSVTPGSEPPAEERGRGQPQTDRVVFGVTAFLTLALVVWGATSTGALESVTTDMLAATMKNGGWAFVLAASGFVVFSLWLAFSRYGRITLGKEGEKPEFKAFSWLAMMFIPGMGIGLTFYGVSEPTSHFAAPPPGTGGDAAERMQTAMSTTLFHWTLYPWAIYAVVGAAIAYSCFRRGRRQTISAVFTPLIGEKQANGTAGRVIDILAIFATLFGSAASLGLGALQIASGVKEVNQTSQVGTPTLIMVIEGLTAVVVAYVLSGVHKGIQRLVNVSTVLSTLLVVHVLMAGPTARILGLVPTSVSSFVGDLPQMASRTYSSVGTEGADWLASWTVFYWAWWISWTPLVGMFIARISRGRTIRQFAGGVILVPSVVSLIWFAVFGGTAIHLERNGANVSGKVTAENQLFAVLREYPISGATILIALLLAVFLYVSGTYAASTVLGTLSQKGTLEPSKSVVVVWGVLTGKVAAIMLLIGGGRAEAITGLKNLTILVAVPFTLVMVGMCIAMTRDVRSERPTRSGRSRAPMAEAGAGRGRAEA